MGNVILVFSCALWLTVPLLNPLSNHGSTGMRFPELLVAGVVYFMCLGLLRSFTFLCLRMSTQWREWFCCNVRPADPKVDLDNLNRFNQWVRIAYIYTFDYQLRMFGALFIFIWFAVLSLFMLILEIPQ